ncbi:MAG: phosphoribosylglycinamide formyltransferase [Planctomycetota bacterium]|jgi:phosphoribosylglycinamide formyltransferase-1
MTRLVCLASGGGRTILNLQDRIEAGTLDAEIALVITNRECKAVERARARGLAAEIVPWPRGTTPEAWAEIVWPRIEQAGATLVCNCGFLRLLLVPAAFMGRIMNIHPALLPKFGGKGMYGDHVHRAVLESGDPESGCTVHFVTNEYDTGPIILQRRVPVEAGDTADSLAARVFEAECEAYPEAITAFTQGRLAIEDGKVTIT